MTAAINRFMSLIRVALYAHKSAGVQRADTHNIKRVNSWWQLGCGETPMTYIELDRFRSSIAGKH